MCVNETWALYHSSQLYEPQKPFRPHLWLPLFFYKRHSSTCISSPSTIYQWRCSHPHREREREGWVMLVQMRLKLVCCFWTVQHSQLSAASIMQRHEEEKRCHTEQKTDSERMKWDSVNRQRQTADERGELDHWQMCEVVSPPKYSDFQI